MRSAKTPTNDYQLHGITQLTHRPCGLLPTPQTLLPSATAGAAGPWADNGQYRWLVTWIDSIKNNNN